ncbi:uncharacterized protein M421DRAFT_306496 [Didymella exigua CBS 183.55]|uniref:Uncharacterized protein n=1 Tax=Didymella exigua CBS 183.55 TaxID=1150837 RepID=A0A6A5R6R1_9PLEO|nr:uncharacterized protein M421DRAFT_306496 [Didymella exigua CBS 183.55]KAF1923825.1 hypothetical protein M421DRAFT_306496 [Didymella exigua CBS 183.55]
MLLSTSYLSCITNTSSKQTPQRALESKDTSRTTTQNNTIHSLYTFALDTATNQAHAEMLNRTYPAA